MAPRPVALWLIALVALAGAVLAGTQEVFWTGDFMDEAWPAYELLTAGDVGAAYDRAPGYLAFVLVIGFPAALLTDALGGAETSALRLTAVPGVLVLAGLLVALARAPGTKRSTLARLALLLVATAPLVREVLLAGHPEDLLAGAGAVGAVVLAMRGRPLAAALLLIVAVAAKQWAVLAILPAVLAAPAGDRRGRTRLAALAITGSALVVGAETLLHPVALSAAIPQGGVADFFHPHQVWWPLGVPSPPEWAADGHGEVTSPAWLRPLTHPLVVLVGVAVSAAWWLRTRTRPEGRAPVDALALLALVFLARCALDPWNLGYYHLPLVLALAAWGALRARDEPVLALAVTAAVWVSFIGYDAREGMGPFVLYLAWTVPLAALLAARLDLLPRRYSRARWPAAPTSAAPRPSLSTSTS